MKLPVSVSPSLPLPSGRDPWWHRHRFRVVHLWKGWSPSWVLWLATHLKKNDHYSLVSSNITVANLNHLLYIVWWFSQHYKSPFCLGILQPHSLRSEKLNSSWCHLQGMGNHGKSVSIFPRKAISKHLWNQTQLISASSGWHPHSLWRCHGTPSPLCQAQFFWTSKRPHGTDSADSRDWCPAPLGSRVQIPTLATDTQMMHRIT